MYFEIPKETITLDFMVYLQGTYLASMDIQIVEQKGQMTLYEFLYSKHPSKSVRI